MITLAAALALQAAAPAADLPDADAFRLGLEQVCLPKASGADATAAAKALNLKPIPMMDLPNRTSILDRAWRLNGSGNVMVVSWGDGTCSVQQLRGEPGVALRCDGCGVAAPP